MIRVFFCLCVVQEKADLQQRARVLELEDQETVLMKEESKALKEVERFIFVLSFTLF